MKIAGISVFTFSAWITLIALPVSTRNCSFLSFIVTGMTIWSERQCFLCGAGLVLVERWSDSVGVVGSWLLVIALTDGG